nr:hypothetical protein [Rhodoferax sp. AJA081-3]
MNLTRRVAQALAPAFHLHQVVDAFRHGQGPNGHGRDLTGYEDGTETPKVMPRWRLRWCKVVARAWLVVVSSPCSSGCTTLPPLKPWARRRRTM